MTHRTILEGYWVEWCLGSQQTQRGKVVKLEIEFGINGDGGQKHPNVDYAQKLTLRYYFM